MPAVRCKVSHLVPNRYDWLTAKGRQARDAGTRGCAVQPRAAAANRVTDQHDAATLSMHARRERAGDGLRRKKRGLSWARRACAPIRNGKHGEPSLPPRDRWHKPSVACVCWPLGRPERRLGEMMAEQVERGKPPRLWLGGSRVAVAAELTRRPRT